MPAHEDALLAAAGPIEPGFYFDFDKERVCPLPSTTLLREQGMKDARAEKPKLSSNPAYLRGYELGEQLRALRDR